MYFYYYYYPNPSVGIFDGLLNGLEAVAIVAAIFICLAVVIRKIGSFGDPPSTNFQEEGPKTKYRIVEMTDSEWRTTETDDIAKWAAEHGLAYRLTDFQPGQRVEQQPILPGFVGPTWDGDAIRYENTRAYDVLSTYP